MATTKVTRREDGKEVEIIVGLTPLPSPRPRVSKFGTYFPPSYTAHRKEFKALVPPAAITFTGDVLVEIECVCEPIKKSKFTTPKGDVDNFAKTVTDTLTDLKFYEDDRQIVDLYVRKRFPAEGEEPHYRINLIEID